MQIQTSFHSYIRSVPFICIATFLVLSAPLVGEAWGQATGGSRTSSGKPKSSGTPVTITQTVQHAFKIEPIVQMMEGRKGDVIPFEFDIESAGRETKVEIQAVGLRQELSGMILNDPAAIMNGLIQFDTPASMTLTPNQRTKIRGVVRVPNIDSNFYTFGILVKDLGSNPDGNSGAANGTQATINFVTQYILRCDIAITGSRSELASRIELKKGEVITIDGRPVARLTIANPTDTPFEFEAKFKIQSETASATNKLTRMVMPIRASMSDEPRFAIRLMPESTIHVQEFVPDPLFAGDYQLHCELSSSGRVFARQSFSVQVENGDFPAQDSTMIQFADRLSAIPAQIALSHQRGGTRLENIVLRNDSKTSATVVIDAVDSNGNMMEGVRVRPEQVTISSNSTRKISVSLNSVSHPVSTKNTSENDSDSNGDSKLSEAKKKETSLKDRTGYSYGMIRLRSKGRADATSGDTLLPLAVMGSRKTSPTGIKLENLRWDENAEEPTFRVDVINSGEQHLPIEALLTIRGEAIPPMAVRAGFGKWLLPRQTTSVAFSLPTIPPEGEYEIECALANEDKPLQVKQTIKLAMPSSDEASTGVGKIGSSKP